MYIILHTLAKFEGQPLTLNSETPDPWDCGCGIEVFSPGHLTLRPLDSHYKVHRHHIPGGSRRPMALFPQFGGRTRKEKPVDNPYTAANPCRVKTLGTGLSKGRGCRNEVVFIFVVGLYEQVHVATANQ